MPEAPLTGCYHSSVSDTLKGRGAAPHSPAPQPGDGGKINPVAKSSGLATIAHYIYGDDRKLQVALLTVMVVWYGALLGISWRLAFGSFQLDLTFNSMLAHLLHGQFDVDPQIVGFEGYRRNGLVYSYFGIWCALLRLPLFVIHRMDLDVTIGSCLAATCIAGTAKVRVVLWLRRHRAREPLTEWASGLMLAYIVFGGSQAGYLSVSIYQEVVFWAAAFGAIFVYFAMKGLVSGRFDTKTLSWMGLCAGLAVLTRVSTGIGESSPWLWCCCCLCSLCKPGNPDAAHRPSIILRLGRSLTQRRFLLPLGILAALIVVTGVVNYFRWGNPTTFVNIDLYLSDSSWPDRLQRIHQYGLFNVSRIPFAVVYYFSPRLGAALPRWSAYS